MKPFVRVGLAALCLLGVACLSTWYGARLRASFTELDDFTGIVAGAYLVGTPGLYELEPNLKLQQELVGATDPARVFPRWPYWGALLKPLSWIPYRQATRVWMGLMVAAFAAFVFLFPMTPRWITALAVCWSIPAFDALGQGQDSPTLLVFLAVAMLFHRADRPFLAGVALAFCAPKYHIFVLLPLLIVIQRRWQLLAGGVAGGVGLILGSCVVQDWSWPVAHLRNIRRPEIDTFPGIMPNLRGVLEGFAMKNQLELALAAVVVVWIGWLLMRKRISFEQSLSLALIGGMLVSHHAYLHDTVLLVPAFLTLGATLPECRPAAVVMLSPLATGLLSIVPTPLLFGNVAFVLLLVGFLGWVSAEISALYGQKPSLEQ